MPLTHRLIVVKSYRKIRKWCRGIKHRLGFQQPVLPDSPFNKLPSELSLLIIEYSLPIEPYHESYAERQRLLRSYSLVSRQFRQVAQPLLFRIGMYVKPSKDVARHRRKVVKGLTNSELVEHVRHLFFEFQEDDLTFDNTALTSILESCSSLESLSLDDGRPLRLRGLLSQNRSIVTLNLRGNAFIDSPFLLRANWLQHLSLVQPCARVAILSKLLSITSLPRLRSCVLSTGQDRADRDGYTSLDIATTMSLSQTFLVNLTALSIDTSILAKLTPAFFSLFADTTLVICNCHVSSVYDYPQWETIRYLAIDCPEIDDQELILENVTTARNTPALELLFLSLELQESDTCSVEETTEEFVEELLASCKTREIKVIWTEQTDEWGINSGAWPVFREMALNGKLVAQA